MLTVMLLIVFVSTILNSVRIARNSYALESRRLLELNHFSTNIIHEQSAKKALQDAVYWPFKAAKTSICFPFVMASKFVFAERDRIALEQKKKQLEIEEVKTSLQQLCEFRDTATDENEKKIFSAAIEGLEKQLPENELAKIESDRRQATWDKELEARLNRQKALDATKYTKCKDCGVKFNFSVPFDLCLDCKLLRGTEDHKKCQDCSKVVYIKDDAFYGNYCSSCHYAKKRLETKSASNAKALERAGQSKLSPFADVVCTCNFCGAKMLGTDVLIKHARECKDKVTCPDCGGKGLVSYDNRCYGCAYKRSSKRLDEQLYTAASTWQSHIVELEQAKKELNVSTKEVKAAKRKFDEYGHKFKECRTYNKKYYTWEDYYEDPYTY